MSWAPPIRAFLMVQDHIQREGERDISPLLARLCAVTTEAELARWADDGGSQ